MLLVVLCATLVATLDIALAGDPCTTYFNRYCAMHSYCLPKNTSCINFGGYVTDDQKNQILSLHNKLRSTVATGGDEEGLPTARDMLQLEWDDELAAVAQKYAEQCNYEHDKPNCRQVANFNVGQNLAQQTYGGISSPPDVDWGFAVNAWYDEIKLVGEDNIRSLQPPPPQAREEDDYRHFTQLAWAETFRVGCAYSIYNTIPTDYFRVLYVCNYGPTGNIYDTPVYEEGPACSNCPNNSCCGNSCSSGDTYPGLCQRTDSDAPFYPPPPNLFFCSFQHESDCAISAIDGAQKWQTQTTLDGNRLTIVLDGGESSTINFTKTITPTKTKFCLTLRYRKGPNVDGKEQANTAAMIVRIPTANYEYAQTLPSYSGKARHQFSAYNLTLSWKNPSTFALSFSVPDGKPAQFFDVSSILASEGECQNHG